MKCSLHLLGLVVLACLDLGESATVSDGHETHHRRINLPFFKPKDSKAAQGEKKEDHVVFRLFNRDHGNSPEEVDSRHLHPFTRLSRGKPIKVIIHGWRGHGACTFTKNFREALLKLSDVNVIAVDWSGYGSRSNMYPTARGNVPAVASKVAMLLDLLAGSAGVNLGNVHILGHSLGGQIAGITGHLVKKGKIGRITGFDPAGPSFSLQDKAGRLSADSARFVDVIHTTANLLGFSQPIGHVDFYPNSGTAIQPGCGMDVIGRCSHRRSYEFYIDSLARPNSLPAVSCQDWAHFMQKICNGKNVVLMGINTPTSARGVYYLQTNNASPFGRDSAGLSYTS